MRANPHITGKSVAAISLIGIYTENSNSVNCEWAVMLYALQHCGLAHRSVKHRIYIPPPLLVAVFYLNGLYAIPKMERAKTVILLLGLFLSIDQLLVFEVGQVSQTTPFSTPT